MSELFEEQLEVEDVELPSELPVLPLKDTVVFPDSVLPLAIGQERSVRLVDDVVSGNRLLALVASKDADIETPGWDDLHEIGAAAVVQKMLRVPDGSLRILVQGIRRIRLIDKLQDEPYLVGRFIEVPDVYEETPQTQALSQNVQNLFARLIGLVPYLPEELALAAANVDDPSALCHLVASTLRLKTAEKQQLLELDDVEKRLRAVLVILNRELEVAELGSKIQNQVVSEMESTQREYFLRQQLKAIQEELGESDPEQAEITELRNRANEVVAARGVPQGGRSRAGAARQAARGFGRIRRHPHVRRVDHQPALGQGDAGQPRPRQGAQGARRRPLRPGEGQGPDHRVPRGLEAQGGRPLGADPLLRRPARSRQDLARPVDREDARPQVHAHLGRRRPRRGRDPRSPEDVHRRAARHDHPGAPRLARRRTRSS